MKSNAWATFDPIAPNTVANTHIWFTLIDDTPVTLVVHDKANLGGPPVFTKELKVDRP
jgi:hypothetical protein